MAIPPRRSRMIKPTRFIVISVVVLIGLIASLYVLKQKASMGEAVVDTLQVNTDGLLLNHKPIEIGKLSGKYPADNKRHNLHVIFDAEVEFGRTWEIEDTLRSLLETKENLTVTGITTEPDFVPVE
ncbi:hypothetical protein GF359_08195 [candidate division WOR-3 bacterium]|uniref:Uncharacterized protein n=1 Tax=candidate division WOR-3 bacterium TaxID=2052148 RepID=A0A9D5KCM4_UNCW3|nr:hypothetical protein [candidate division WOR-3 bacterium]MBD3365181.1 hypothetical protein [candidate division WOR-3 bacterium]